MKEKIFIALMLIFGFRSSAYSQGNWELFMPTPASNHLVGMYFIDNQTGWSVGEYGTILKSTDGGENWSIKEIPWTFDLSDIYFPTPQTGYAIGTDGFIIKSVDAGETWEQLENRYVNNLVRVLFRDEDHGWVIGEKGIILYTSNGGTDWSLQSSKTNIVLNGIDLIDTNSALIVGEQETILITHDNGQIWQSVSWDSSDSKTYSFKDVYFIDEQTGWIGGGYEMYTVLIKTTDGGKTWTWVKQSGGSFKDFYVNDGQNPYLGPLQQIYFYNDMKTGIGLFSASNLRDFGNIPMKTTDGGTTWSSIMWGKCEQFIGKGRFCVLDDQRVICTGFHGDFKLSTNSGSVWHLSPEEGRWWKDLTIGENGQILLHEYCSNMLGQDIDRFLRSSDYGATWSEFEPVFVDSNNQSLAVSIGFYFHFGQLLDNQDTLWLLQGIRHDTLLTVFRSTDFGYTYQEVGKASSRFNPIFTSFLTPDTLISYIFDYQEIRPNVYTPVFQFISSYDGGSTVDIFRGEDVWNSFSTESFFADNINAHFFINSRRGFLIGTDGNIVKTEDAGQSWENIYSGVVEDLHDITFIDQQTGFTVGDFGRILKTDDGGMTWRKTNSGTQEDVLTIEFINNREGWVGTENGLRYTTDAGETWQGVPLRYAHGKYDRLIFDHAGNGYAYSFPTYGHSGYDADPCSHKQLLRMRTSINAIDYPQSEITHPAILVLSPNYPNPFNASTRIEYYLPKTGDVQLKIFNIRGELVRTLVDRPVESGNHLAVWNGQSDSGSPVSSGVYIYQLECGDQVKRQKLLLLK